MNEIKKKLPFILEIVFTIACFGLWYIKHGGQNIASDGAFYYQYFVRAFITKDFIGSGLIKYPIGTTLLQLPFLLLALLVSKVFGIDAEGGMAGVFQFAVFAAALFYLILTLHILYDFIIKRFKRKSAILTTICLTFGTMIPVYVCDLSSFSHIYGFFICSVFFVFVSFYEKARSRENALVLDFLLGVILGICVIIRNTNIIIGAAYLFYGVMPIDQLFKRIKTVFSSRLIFQFIGGVSIYSIQLVAWKLQTGKWVLYSYGNEEFVYKMKPQIMKVLFSDAKGLFIYSPILFVAVIAMLLYFKKIKEYSLSQVVIFVFITYIIAAWWCWWLGGAYGERMFCDMLCIFALPLASLFDDLEEFADIMARNSKLVMARIIPGAIYLLCAIFIMLNLVWIRGTQTGAISNNMAMWSELRDWIYKGIIK